MIQCYNVCFNKVTSLTDAFLINEYNMLFICCISLWVCRSLARNSRLELIDISSNNIGDDSIRSLSQTLLKNRSLRELNLENCGLTSTGSACTALSRALRANTALRSLQISRNALGDTGMASLADGLKYNGTLETLSANMCGVGNTGFAQLLEALRSNAVLTTIKLCYNNIGQGAKTNAEGVNQTLLQQQEQQLEDHNGVNQQQQQQCPSLAELYEKLREVLHQNPRLRMLLWGNELDSFPAFRAYTDADHTPKTVFTVC